MEKYFIILAGLLLVSIIFSIMQITKASPAVPNPGHPADQIEPGTFASGDYTFLNNLTANGTVNATSFVGLGVVPIGSIIAHHLTDVPGADDLDAVRAAGFAICDGTTPEAQGITDAVITGATPDLNSDIDGNGGRFLRGNSTSGIEQVDEFKSHSHEYIMPLISYTRVPGGTSKNVMSIGHAMTYLKGGDETRPINMSVVWIMRVK